MTTTASICPDGRLPTGKAAFLLLALATSSCRWSTCNGFVPSASWIASRGVAGLRVGCRPGPWARCKNPAGATAVRKRPGWRCSSTPVPVVGTGERWIGPVAAGADDEQTRHEQVPVAAAITAPPPRSTSSPPTTTASRKYDRNGYAEMDDDAVSVSIESIAAALESGQRQSVRVSPASSPKHLRPIPPRSKHNGSVAHGNGGSKQVWGEGGRRSEHTPKRRRERGAEQHGGREKTACGKESGPPNKESLKKRRARANGEVPLVRQHQSAVAIHLKANDAAGTLKEFNVALKDNVALPGNLLCGVLNQFAKAGWMDDCMRVCQEMKARGLVIEENTFVPLIRGMVAQGDSRGALDLIVDMVKQGIQPRLRCYEPVIAAMCEEGNMDGAREAWEHMEERNVIPRETQYMNFLCGLANAGELWKEAAEDSGKLDDLLFSMSYRARNITMDQANEFETAVNTLPTFAQVDGSDFAQDVDAASILRNAAATPPLARRVKLATFHDGEDEDDWSRGWSHAVTKQPTTCPACGGFLTAVGLTPDERARIRDTLFDMAGLQVKKHSRSRWTRAMKNNKGETEKRVVTNGYFHFTEEDQKEQLQIFVDWLHEQRANGKTFTAVIDSANVAYHKGNPWHFSLPQVDLMVQALEAKGERPLVVIAEKYIDRVDESYQASSMMRNRFRYMRNPLNQAIVKRWRSKSQVYECSDEASDDWYWMYAAVAFDDIPMTVISNDRTRDHRMSLAEPVPFLRWRTTQLAQFELSFGLLNAGKEGVEVNAQGWPLTPPSVAIQAPPGFTRDIQRTKEGSWHLPAGAKDDWLCLDLPRGVKLGLDKLPKPLPLPRQNLHQDAQQQQQQREQEQREEHLQPHRDVGTGAASGGGDSDAAAAAAKADSSDGGRVRNRVKQGDQDDRADDKIRKVGGLLQTMKVKRRTRRTNRVRSQDTVEAASAAAKAAAAALAEQATQLKGYLDKPLPRRSASSTGQRTNDAQTDVPTPMSSTAAVPTASMTSPTNPETEEVVESVPVRQPQANGNGHHRQHRQERNIVDINRSHETGFGDATADGAGLCNAMVMPLRQGGEEDEADRREGSEGLKLERDEVVEGAAAGGTIGRDWASMTVVALKEELRARGLKVSGKKASLVDRLLEAGR